LHASVSVLFRPVAALEMLLLIAEILIRPPVYQDDSTRARDEKLLLVVRGIAQPQTRECRHSISNYVAELNKT
ncbi:hypothetical protein OFC87_34325, partial [Escherichia coli]|nr:hypothetical protein [Escherichia coli]